MSEKEKKEKKRREVVYTGTNQQGNQYRVYSDGAYAYSNKNEETGKTKSTYFDTGAGHAFYQDKANGFKFHENQNKGTKTYQPFGNSKK